MLFGDQDSFAIESVHVANSGKWKYGHLRFWVGGTAIGAFDETADLASSARWGRTFLRESARRGRPDLDALSAREVFAVLYGRLEGRRLVTAVPWDRDPYVLDDLGESALRDRFALVVVRQGDGCDHVMAMSLIDDVLREVVVPVGFCDEVIAAYCDWVDGK